MDRCGCHHHRHDFVSSLGAKLLSSSFRVEFDRRCYVADVDSDEVGTGPKGN